VAAAGSDQTASVRTTATAFSFNASTGDLIAPGSVTAYSDKKLKSNIRTIDDALDIIKNIRGVRFDRDGRPGIGVVAQEIKPFIPEVVIKDNDALYYSVAYGNIVGVLIQAIKEQQEQIDELKKEINHLKPDNK
jgi:hypothetical protein